MTAPTSLEGLLTREAIIDAVLRIVDGIDKNDRKLFDSGWAPEPTFGLHGKLSSGQEALETLFANVAPLTTVHYTTNIRVDVEDGADTGTVTSHFLAQHYREGTTAQDLSAPYLLAGGTYEIDVVKGEDASWKVKKFVVSTVWRQGDPSVMQR